MPKIVFACQSNSCRSQMAEGWAREWMRLEWQKQQQQQQQQKQQYENDDDIADNNNNTATTTILQRLEATQLYSVALNEDILKPSSGASTSGTASSGAVVVVKAKAIQAMAKSNIDISSHYVKTLDDILQRDEFCTTTTSTTTSNNSSSDNINSDNKPIDKLIVLCTCGENIRQKLERLSKHVCVWNIEAPSHAAAAIAAATATAVCDDKNKNPIEDAYYRVSLEIRDRIFELMEQSVLLSSSSTTMTSTTTKTTTTSCEDTCTSKGAAVLSS